MLLNLVTILTNPVPLNLKVVVVDEDQDNIGEDDGEEEGYVFHLRIPFFA